MLVAVNVLVVGDVRAGRQYCRVDVQIRSAGQVEQVRDRRLTSCEWSPRSSPR